MDYLNLQPAITCSLIGVHRPRAVVRSPCRRGSRYVTDWR
jgi:hypothetical protein